MVSAGFVLLLGEQLQVSCPGDAADWVWNHHFMGYMEYWAVPWSTLSCGKGVLIKQLCDVTGPPVKACQEAGCGSRERVWMGTEIFLSMHQFTWKMGGTYTDELPWALSSSGWVHNSGIAGSLLELELENTPNPSVWLFKCREFAGQHKTTGLWWFWMNWVTEVQSRWCNKVEDLMLICTCCAFGPLQEWWKGWKTLFPAFPTPVALECFSRCTASSCRAKHVFTCQPQQQIVNLMFYECQITPGWDNLQEAQYSVEQKEKTTKLGGGKKPVITFGASLSPSPVRFLNLGFPGIACTSGDRVMGCVWWGGCISEGSVLSSWWKIKDGS